MYAKDVNRTLSTVLKWSQGKASLTDVAHALSVPHHKLKLFLFDNEYCDVWGTPLEGSNEAVLLSAILLWQQLRQRVLIDRLLARRNGQKSTG